MTLGIIIIVITIGVALAIFFLAFSKDREDLQWQTLDQKFSVIVDIINNFAYEGMGSVTILDKREFNLYKDEENQIIKFLYGTGHLTIIWKYKYFQKEVIYKRQFTDVRNLSIFEQKKIADQIIAEMSHVIEKHKKDVLK
jgi:hypothetical protein